MTGQGHDGARIAQPDGQARLGEALAVVESMPEADYHAHPALSYSIAKRIIQPGGIARWWWDSQHGRKPKKAFDFGHAAHRIALGAGMDIRVIPDDLLASNGAATTKEARAFVDQAYADGVVPLKPGEFAQVEAMVQQLTAHTEAMRVLDADGVRHELSAFREVDGVALRCRFDAVAPSVIGDYKTVAGDGANPDRFNRLVPGFGYHIQAAHYSDMAHALGLSDGPFRFVVQEKEPPYLVSVIELDEAWLELGRADMRRAVAIWRDLQPIAADYVAPGYPAGVTTLSPPPWLAPETTALDPAIEAELQALIASQGEAA